MVNDLRPSKNKRVRQGPSFFLCVERERKKNCNGMLKRFTTVYYIYYFFQAVLPFFFLNIRACQFSSFLVFSASFIFHSSFFSCLPIFFLNFFFFFHESYLTYFYTLNLTIDFSPPMRVVRSTAPRSSESSLSSGGKLPLRVSSLSPDIVIAASSSGAALCVGFSPFFL